VERKKIHAKIPPTSEMSSARSEKRVGRYVEHPRGAWWQFRGKTLGNGGVNGMSAPKTAPPQAIDESDDARTRTVIRRVMGGTDARSSHFASPRPPLVAGLR